MEVENKNGATAMESTGGEQEKQTVAVANKRAMSCTDLALRVLALVLTLIAAIVLGTDKQKTNVSVSLVPNLPPLIVPVTAKWHYLSAFLYFVVANSIACGYAAMSLILTMLNGGKTKGSLSFMIIILDIVMVALLFSSGSAATAVGVLGEKGNSHVQWNKVCNMVEKFCHQVAVALSISMAGAVVYLLLVLLATWKLYKKH